MQNMLVKIEKQTAVPQGFAALFLCEKPEGLDALTKTEKDYVVRKLEKSQGNGQVILKQANGIKGVAVTDTALAPAERLEALRRWGAELEAELSAEHCQQVALVGQVGDADELLAWAEGLALARYRFEKYKTKAEALPVLEIALVGAPSEVQVEQLNQLVEAVFVTRDLVNEPVSYLTAVKLGETIQDLAQRFGFSTEVFNKQKIEALKMGGILGVNRGSVDPPTFSVLEWKPKNAVNERPIVLVGKGVVFDTGGINLKTPPGSLDTMKCDMGGAAAVVGAFVALAATKVPLYVVGLVPATDNRPGGNAIVPGDVLTMHSGSTVEIINTDAEGRLILADALSYAGRYEPELVIDLATLTGNAVMAIGSQACVGMGTASRETQSALEAAGEAVCERVVWFPFWKDYDEAIKSDVADVKNLGGREAGAITAGKFLAHFVSAPWLHLDIAGPAFLERKHTYRGLGGTGFGVRLLHRFLSARAQQ